MPYGSILSDSITDSSGGVLAPSSSVFRNRLINGNMAIDQRNAGASVTQTAALGYCLDRFYLFGSVTSKFTVQQNAASVTPPSGFSNYLGATSSAATSVGSGDTYFIGQRIEGLNTADLAWGTASAASVTLSFWVRSSLTGTFGGSIRNSAQNRSYPFTYTINSANTWEKETITIAGDTSGTWLSTNGIGIDINFNMGTGSTLSGTAGAWAASNFTSATGATSVVGTNGATFYITGVQLEKGSTATSFDYRPYGTELALAQRYYQMSYPQGIVAGTASYIGPTIQASTALAGSTSGNTGIGTLGFKVSMRTSPTFVLYAFDGTANAVIRNSTTNRTGVTAISGAALAEGYVQFITFNNSSATAIAATDTLSFNYTASAEL
jgi:hypothetical protein